MTATIERTAAVAAGACAIAMHGPATHRRMFSGIMLARKRSNPAWAHSVHRDRVQSSRRTAHLNRPQLSHRLIP
jgi:hypothetical protein